LAEQQIRAVEPGESMAYGKFSVTFFVSKHWPLPEPYASLMANATIDVPLVPPAPFEAYKEGKTYSILLEHPLGNMLIQGSAGYLPGALDSVDVDTIFLSIGGLGDLPPDEQENYYREMVTVTGARNIIPIHWDTAITPLNEPLVPYEDFDRAIFFLIRRGQMAGRRTLCCLSANPSCWT
jgi:L-ascorbate metabolism protein UlaG (beta-lactamase superfamily)